DKSISNVIGVLRPMFEAAILEELVDRQPVALPRKTLKRAPAVEREIYQRHEVSLLIGDERISWPHRVLNAMLLLAGLREGEALGRRVRDIYWGPKPLGCMAVATQYDDRPLKTDNPRNVPIHPALEAILRDWLARGFRLYVGRDPEPDDFIVPATSARAKTEYISRSTFYKAFRSNCRAVGVRHRSVHATRHTFITAARRGGSPADVLERVTHNAQGKIID